VDDLVARGRYAHAAAVLRAEIQGRTATTDERLRLADLLVMAERGEQAVPILLGLADELARYGFTDRALEALRRADAIAPGRSEVRSRFESLSRAARARIAQAASRRPDEKTDSHIESRPAPRPASRQESLPIDMELLAFVRALGDSAGKTGREALARALFCDLQHYLFRQTSDGLHRRSAPAGAIVVSEGDAGDSIFLIASGSVRVLVVGGHGRALEIRRLDAGDFFGEVAALSGRPRSATVVAVADCELLEVDRWALERLVESRPEAGPILEGTRDVRAQSPEEETVRALPADAGPNRAAAVLAAHFGSAEWSPRVQLRLAKMMLDAGQENDALAVILRVAEEMARQGNGETAMTMLRKVGQLRRRESGSEAPHGPGTEPPRVSQATSEAAFRLWVASLSREPEALSRPAAASAVEEGADHRRRR
jgi:CRP-like cAMP-binding protein